MVLKKFIDPDCVCVERLVPDPVKIRPDPKPLHYKVMSGGYIFVLCTYVYEIL